MYLVFKWPDLTHMTSAQNGQFKLHNSVKNHFHWKSFRQPDRVIHCFHSYNMGYDRATLRWPIKSVAKLNTNAGTEPKSVLNNFETP